MPYKDPEKQKEYLREHYKRNKKEYQLKAKKLREDRQTKLRQLKCEAACCICGEDDPRCLDFHHRDPKEKNFGITTAVRDRVAWDTILEEIQKCDLICANCHRKGHANSVPSGRLKKGNRSPQYEQNKRRIERARQFIKQVRGNSKCKNCGESRPECLDFHHRHGKDFTISKLVVRKATIPKLKEAIARCDVLCANCHRIEHGGNIWEQDSNVKRNTKTNEERTD